MTLKEMQEIWDNCNFSDYMKKIFPKPETEEDLERIMVQSFGASPLLSLLLDAIFGNGSGGWGDNSFYESLQEMKIDKTEKPEL